MALRTASYESILKGCANLAGVKREQLLSDTASLLFEFINTAFREGVEHDWWPEYRFITKILAVVAHRKLLLQLLLIGLKLAILLVT